MARKTRARPRHRPRRAKTRPVGARLRAIGSLARGGWARFAAGILIGLAIGIGAVLYVGGLDLALRNGGGVKVTTLNATPVQKPAQKPAEKTAAPKPAVPPQIVEPAPASPPAPGRPLGEEAASAAPAEPPKPVAPPPADPQVASGAPAAPINAGSEAAWLKNSVAFAVPPGRPLIAVVLDDVGVARSHAEMAIDMPAVITLSFMTYADGVADMAARAHAKGHELMLHVPMEPLDGDVDAGPQRADGRGVGGRAAEAPGLGPQALSRLYRHQQPHGQPLHPG